jgi:hypothetical protein
VANFRTFRYSPGRTEESHVKGKGKVVRVPFLTEHHPMKACLRSGGIAPLIL